MFSALWRFHVPVYRNAPSRNKPDKVPSCVQWTECDGVPLNW